MLDVDARYLDGDLDLESRDRMLVHYRDARDAARNRIADAMATPADASHLRHAVEVFVRLPDVWGATTPEACDVLAGSIWPSGLVYDSAGCRTPGGVDLIGPLVGVKAENGSARPSAKIGRPIQRPGQDPDRTTAARLAELYGLKSLIVTV